MRTKLYRNVILLWLYINTYINKHKRSSKLFLWLLISFGSKTYFLKPELYQILNSET